MTHTEGVPVAGCVCAHSAAREAVGGADSETARSLAETELSVAESMVEAAKGTGA